MDTGVWIGGGILYVVLLVTLGIMAIRKGHWFMFILGIFIPIFWIIGALMPPSRDAAAASAYEERPPS